MSRQGRSRKLQIQTLITNNIQTIIGLYLWHQDVMVTLVSVVASDREVVGSNPASILPFSR